MDVPDVSQELGDSLFPSSHSFKTTHHICGPPEPGPGAKLGGPLKRGSPVPPPLLECSHLWADVGLLQRARLPSESKCVSKLEDDSRGRWSHLQAWQVSGTPSC